MLLTEEDVIDALEKVDIPMSKRVLTDWRQKRYLPPLASRSQGRRGRIYYWTDSKVIEQAVLVDQILGANLEGKQINFVLWCFGFDIPVPIVRKVLIDAVRRFESRVTGNRQSGDEKEDYVFALVTKYQWAAKQHPELQLPPHDPEQMQAYLNLFTNPDYDLEASPFDDQCDVANNKDQELILTVNGNNTLPLPGTMAAAEMIRQYASTNEVKRVLEEVPDKLFAKVHADISRLLPLLAQMFKNIAEIAKLYALRFHAVEALGTIAAIAGLSARHHGKSDAVDEFVDQWANNLADHLRKHST